MTLQEIEQTIANLSPEQLAEFRVWFEAFNAGPLTPAQVEEINQRLDALDSGELPPGEEWNKVKVWLQTL